MTDHFREAVAILRAAGIESARADVRILQAHAVARGLPFEALLRRRLAHEPVAYIVGQKEFWSLAFEVGPGVLIPRPESEILVEEALAATPDRTLPYRVLDLGTGSGCLLIAVLKELPNATGLGLDISEAALLWAHRNVQRHGLEDRVQLARHSWKEVTGAFDFVVCNPPYIQTGELPRLSSDIRQYEPTGALDGGPDGLNCYRSLGGILSNVLIPSGRAFLEISAGQHHLVTEVMEGAGLSVVNITPDLAGIPRCLEIRAA